MIYLIRLKFSLRMKTPDYSLLVQLDYMTTNYSEVIPLWAWQDESVCKSITMLLIIELNVFDVLNWICITLDLIQINKLSEFYFVKILIWFISKELKTNYKKWYHYDLDNINLSKKAIQSLWLLTLMCWLT